MSWRLAHARNRRVATEMRRVHRRELRQSPLKRWIWRELDRQYEIELGKAMDSLIYGDMSGPFAIHLRVRGE